MRWYRLASSEKFEVLSPEAFQYGEADDDFYYHVTTTKRLPAILKSGITPGSASTVKGWYESYSKDKSFFCERGQVKWWADRIEEHLFHSFDDPPDVVVVRFPKPWVLERENDAVGTEDSRAPSYYTQKPISVPKGLDSSPSDLV